MPPATASQTIGPYWHLLEDAAWADLTRFGAAGEIITLSGRVIDGEGQMLTDACVEIWQAEPAAGETFGGFGRAATDDDGCFRFTTIKPGPLPGPGNSRQAPHIALTILARGLLFHLATRVYFSGEPGNEEDPVLRMIAPERRQTLLARPAGAGRWHIDIFLQGAHETVFLAI